MALVEHLDGEAGLDESMRCDEAGQGIFGPTKNVIPSTIQNDTDIDIDTAEHRLLQVEKSCLNCRVLELGAGVGAVGLFLALFKGCEVWLTEASDRATAWTTGQTGARTAPASGARTATATGAECE